MVGRNVTHLYIRRNDVDINNNNTTTTTNNNNNNDDDDNVLDGSFTTAWRVIRWDRSELRKD